MAYIPSHQTLADHPKLKRFARRLQISEVQAIGHLHLLWWWAMDYSKNGSLYGRDVLDIAIASRWDGDENTYTASLIECGFIDDDGEGELSLHDWDEYGGKYQEKREKDATRKREERAVQRTNSTVLESSTGRPKEIQRTDRQGEKRREENISPPTPSEGVPPKRRSTKTPVPDDLAATIPPDEWASIGKEQAMDDDYLHAETRKMIDHFQANGERMVNWVAAWRKWMRSPYRKPTPIRANGYGGGDWFTIRGKQYPMVNGLVRLGSIEYPPDIAQLEHNNSRRLRYEQEWRDAHANVS